MAWSMESARIDSSSLTSMRTAWKVRLAGWPPVRRAAAGMAPRDHVGQLGRGRERAGGDDGPGDPGGEALVAVGAQHPRQLVGRVAVHHVGCRASLASVLSHVEWSFVSVGEAPLGEVELRR